jgi:hypothetical protein
MVFDDLPVFLFSRDGAMCKKREAESWRPMTAENARFKAGRLPGPFYFMVLLCSLIVLSPDSGALALEAGEVLVVVNAADRAGTEYDRCQILVCDFVDSRSATGEKNSRCLCESVCVRGQYQVLMDLTK